jgi:TetR/AcrR family transcriptional regulator, repressor for neighboring sulfatase
MGEPIPSSKRRDEIMAAMVKASLEMASVEPASALSLREIAQEAGVQHSDVYRYFGSKKELIKAAMNMAAEREVAILRSSDAERPEREELLRAWRDSSVGRVLLWAALEGVEPGELLDGPVPSMTAGARFVARRRREVDGEAAEGVDARVVVAVITAIIMSLQAAEPILIKAAGLEHEDPAWIRQSIAEVVTKVYWLAAPERLPGESGEGAGE